MGRRYTLYEETNPLTWGDDIPYLGRRCTLYEETNPLTWGDDLEVKLLIVGIIRASTVLLCITVFTTTTTRSLLLLLVRMNPELK